MMPQILQLVEERYDSIFFSDSRTNLGFLPDGNGGKFHRHLIRDPNHSRDQNIIERLLGSKAGIQTKKSQ